ncbi:MAG TPA: formate dehydrogenase accessory sulfurtransferase FdhD [Methanocorpusculum sp.]|nr:formate dehydrogenase accessory sulfurtransferase FdhD [Methanocorpusculum sp.]
MNENVISFCNGYRYMGGCFSEVNDIIVRERLITLFLNGKPYLRISASCDMLLELGAGFFLTAGVVERILSVRVEGTNVFVEGVLRCDMPQNGFSPVNPSRNIVLDGVRVSPEEIFTIREALNTKIWWVTGGLHSAALWYRHRCVVVASDIGRHNAVDKVIGFMVLAGLPPEDCIIGSTGRQPAGMVVKAVNAGIPIIVTRAAVTMNGAELAEKSGITLIGFARKRRFTVYTHPNRIMDLQSVLGFVRQEKEYGALFSLLPGLCYCNKGMVKSVEDVALVECIVTLYLNKQEFIKTVVSCDFLHEFAVGFFVTVGLVCSPSDILSVGVVGLEVFVNAACTTYILGEMESAGGFAPLQSRRIVNSEILVTPEEIFTIRESFNVDMWAATGGLHSSVLFHNHKVVFLASDVGRHNAVDKVIGFMVLAGLPPEDCIIGSTGRVSAGVVAKVANAGIPIVVSRAAATDSGIAMAKECSVTLVCFTRSSRFTIYTCPERVVTESAI